jgi:hypothetical protein
VDFAGLDESVRSANHPISAPPAAIDAAVTQSTSGLIEESLPNEPGPPTAATMKPNPIAASEGRIQLGRLGGFDRV